MYPRSVTSRKGLCVGVALVGALGCDSPSPTPAVDAAVADARDAASDVGGAALATFHGVPVRGWDRSMPEVDAIGYEVDLTVDEATAKMETFRGELRGLFFLARRRARGISTRLCF